MKKTFLILVAAVGLFANDNGVDAQVRSICNANGSGKVYWLSHIKDSRQAEVECKKFATQYPDQLEQDECVKSCVDGFNNALKKNK